ncbi:MAG: NUDIX domain-containing protein [Bacilli bacterium]|nr:NUDIX domain-containing protein [Bacilli bacterium]
MGHVLSKTILISQVVEMIARKYKLSMEEARNNFYDSDVIEMLDDDETGLYGESALYLFSLYEEYLKNRFIKIVGSNYLGEYCTTRKSCRAIVIEKDNILLSYETKTDTWMIPGGGQEKGETEKDCVIRELAEETGYLVEPIRCALTINEYYGNERFLSKYYLSTIKGKAEVNLTEREKQNGMEPRWLPIKDAISIFSEHQKYAETDEMRRGLYLREYRALTKVLSK